MFANRNQAVAAVNKLDGEALQVKIKHILIHIIHIYWLIYTCNLVEEEEDKKTKGKKKQQLIQAQVTELTSLADEECTKYIPRKFNSCNKRDGKL